MRTFSWIRNLSSSIFIVTLLVMVTLFILDSFAYDFESSLHTRPIVRGNVSITSKVSGSVESKQSAKLSFPTIGTVKEIFKHEGDEVAAGEVIASLIADSLIADYTAALYSLKYLESVKKVLIRGPQSEAREVTNTTVKVAEDTLLRTQEEQKRLVQNAYNTLLSSDLEALPTHTQNDDAPPTITGSYTCGKAGTYTLSVFRSGAPTNYSYTLSGLEKGTFTAWTDTSAPLGLCGLSIQFDSDELYQNEEWAITIPNIRSASYLLHQNAYELALEQQKKEVSAAEFALVLARDSKRYSNAAPTNEVLEQANAQIEQAKAVLANREARIADYIIKAPFNGTVTDIDMKVGETVDLTKNIRILGDGVYELKARIPEIDIRGIDVGDVATVVFDASPREKIPALIDFVSPLSTEVDGSSYYEARIALTYEPTWIREGLNADIEILVDKKQDVSIIPKQYFITEEDGTYVYVKDGVQKRKTAVEIGLIGNDGYAEIINLPKGTELILP